MLFRRECPKNPKSENFVRDNPCQIEGHDHDWVDCPDNPKSENYRPPKRKSKKAPKRTSKKDVQENEDADAEEMIDDTKEETKPRSKKHEDVARKRREESRSLAKESDEVQAKDGPIEPEPTEVVEEDKPKEFVPAPPPKVPAWSSGPPASIKKTSLASSEPADNAEPAPVVPRVEDAPTPPSPAPAVAQHDHKVPEQQSILRQVAERRAARVSRTESEISADESNSEPATKWERGQKLSSGRSSGDETQILGKTRTNPCRKKGHDHQWADCPDNRSSDAYVEKTAEKPDKAERGNPCKKPGHDHDWKHCPDNRHSEEYAAKMEEKKERKMEKEKRREEKQQQQQTQQVEKPRPCRIEGHDHDW